MPYPGEERMSERESPSSGAWPLYGRGSEPRDTEAVCRAGEGGPGGVDARRCGDSNAALATVCTVCGIAAGSAHHDAAHMSAV